MEAHPASKCSTRTVKGLHRFTLEKYSLCKGFDQANPIYSNSFTVGDHQWAIAVFPYGSHVNTEKGISGDIYFGIRVALLSGSDGVRCFYKFRLLDQSGGGNHLSISSPDDGGPILITASQQIGTPYFISRNVLEKSSYLKDDCLKMECTISIVLPPDPEIEIGVTPSVAVPQHDDVGYGFLGMLATGEGSDVVFHVRDKKFRAHKVILLARSPVFESMFAGNLVSHQLEEMVITKVEPQVFKALLHFIYSDTLPEDENCLADGCAFGQSVSHTFAAKLLAAADEYDVKRLKSICESHLWRSISLNRFAETLAVAQSCNASLLKNLCFGYAVDHHADLVDLDGFKYLEKNCPLLLNELVDYLSKEKASSQLQQKEEELPVTTH